MLAKIALMDSAVIRSLLVAVVGLVGLVLSLFGVDEAIYGEKAGKIVDGLMLLLTAGSVFYAAYARATKPTPPLTEQAVDATVTKMQAQERDRRASAAAPPRGFALVSLLQLIVCACLAAAFLFASGCSGTQSAFKAAQTRPATVLPDTAYVLAEQYRAVVKEAADLRETGRLPPGVVEKLQQGANALKPAVLGDPQAVPPKAGLRQLALAFQSVRNAQTEAELQRAVDDAVLAIADFVRTLEDARRIAQ